MDIFVIFLIKMLAIGTIAYVVLMAIGKRQYSSRNVRGRKLETLNQTALTAVSDFTIKYVSQGEIRSGGDEHFCLVYRGEGSFYFYGVPFRTKEGSIIRIELQIPKEFRKIEDPAVRCLILKRVRDYAKNSTFSEVRNASYGAIDAEILCLERTA